MAKLRISIDVDIDQAAAARAEVMPDADLSALLADLAAKDVPKLPKVKALLRLLSTGEDAGVTDITAIIIE